jgi:hypothetical protein
MRTAALVAAAALLAAPATLAADPAGDPAAGATALDLVVGDAVNICRMGVRCPVHVAICDDPKVAVIAGGADGPELRGLSPGKTICSAMTFGLRRIFKVTVKPREERRPGETKPGEERRP